MLEAQTVQVRVLVFVLEELLLSGRMQVEQQVGCL